MFGIGKKDGKPQLVGAKEKREMAEALRQGQGADHIRSRREGQKDDRGVHLVIIWGMSVVAALLAMQGVFSRGFPFRLDIPLFQKWLLAMPPPAVLGDRDMDMLAAALVRGTAFFLLCGIVPGTARILARFDRREGARPHMIFLFLAGALVLGVLLAVAKTL